MDAISNHFLNYYLKASGSKVDIADIKRDDKNAIIIGGVLAKWIDKLDDHLIKQDLVSSSAISKYQSFLIISEFKCFIFGEPYKIWKPNMFPVERDLSNIQLSENKLILKKIKMSSLQYDICIVCNDDQFYEIQKCFFHLKEISETREQIRKEKERSLFLEMSMKQQIREMELKNTHDQIKNFYQNLYKSIKNNVKKFKDSKEISNLLNHFIEKNNLLVYLIPSVFSGVQVQIDQLPNIYLENNNKFVLFDKTNDLNFYGDQIKPEYLKQMLTLTNLFLEKGYIEEELDGYISIWESLKTISKMNIPIIFHNKYGLYFDEDSTLDAMVQNFTNIPTIEHEDYLNIGMFTYYLISKEYITDNYEIAISLVQNKIKESLKRSELLIYEKNLLVESSNYVSIDDIDLMSGEEFENVIGSIFNKLGFSIRITQLSRDQGIDVIAEKNGKKIGIQSKCYSNSVGNKAIQEVVAGIHHYQLDKGLVVTNNYFTTSAKDLATSNNVILWDRNILEEKLIELMLNIK